MARRSSHAKQSHRNRPPTSGDERRPDAVKRENQEDREHRAFHVRNTAQQAEREDREQGERESES
jgi:hypothetical protein